jgi:hypothetical protein
MINASSFPAARLALGRVSGTLLAVIVLGAAAVGGVGLAI